MFFSVYYGRMVTFCPIKKYSVRKFLRIGVYPTSTFSIKIYIHNRGEDMWLGSYYRPIEIQSQILDSKNDRKDIFTLKIPEF